MQLFTAQYRYKGNDRLDITVKGNDPIGKIFAPTWPLVMGYKNKTINAEEYTNIYKNMMRKSYKHHKDIWEEVLQRPSVTFVCFCKANSFCHRYLLAQYFQKLGAHYMGERNIN